MYPASPSDGALIENFTDANMNVTGTPIDPIGMRGGCGYGGIPFDIVDANELLGLLWSFSWSDVTVPYPVDVTIDNVRFF